MASRQPKTVEVCLNIEACSVRRLAPARPSTCVSGEEREERPFTFPPPRPAV